ncbi:MAG TPA: hypothetical protein VLF14_10100 [Candidatus Binatia bacterium]|nr:hypothetical protein [Candidatus Binatia bacterium]
MSDSFQRIESHVVAIGELLEQARRYRPLAAEAERLYLAATRIAARVRRASRTARADDDETAPLEHEIESVAEAARRVVGDFLAGPKYRAMLASLDREDSLDSSRLVAEVFADVEPTSARGFLFVPLSAKRGQALLDPETAADMVGQMARQGIEPQSAPGVGGDANVHPIRLFEGVTGVDAAALVIVSGEDFRAPTLRAPEVGEVLVYARRLKVPLSAGLRRQSPDDWLDVRAGGYAEYRERCRELIGAQGISITDL